MKIRILFITFIAITGWTGLAAGQDDSLNRAREFFDKATTLYEAGKYVDAAEKFKEAYAARPFPQFLFNTGAAYEKLAQSEPATIDHWAKAIDYYQRYLKEQPKAQDKGKVEKRIKKLEAERDRIQKVIETPADPPPDGAAPVDKPKAVTTDIGKSLGDAQIRGLIVIESEPSNAFIYLDDKKGGPLGRTPWSGSLEGEHALFIERKGYKPHETRISPAPDKLLVVQIVMAEEDYLGWLDIKSNVPGANIYIDDKSAGVFSKTPFGGNLKPGKHKIWISAEGYDEQLKEIEIIAGKTHEISATLEGSPVGYLNIRGDGIENTSVYLDGELLCERGPCRKAVKEGRHTVEVRRSGYKPYRYSVDMQARTEILVRASLAKKPGRGDAVWAYLFAGAFAGGGVFLGLQSQGIQTELEDEIAAGVVPPDNKDPRYQRGQIFAAAADGAYVISGALFLTAIYYTFRDKGKPSTGATEVRALAIEPQIGPTYAGIGMEVNF